MQCLYCWLPFAWGAERRLCLRKRVPVRLRGWAGQGNTTATTTTDTNTGSSLRLSIDLLHRLVGRAKQEKQDTERGEERARHRAPHNRRRTASVRETGAFRARLHSLTSSVS